MAETARRRLASGAQPCIWAIIVTNPDEGTNGVFLGTDEAAARAALSLWVTARWEEWMNGIPMPDNHANRVDLFFHEQHSRGDNWNFTVRCEPVYSWLTTKEGN